MPIDKNLLIPIVAGVGGFALKFGWDAGASWLRKRGKRKVDVALQAVHKAKLTPDDKDDVIAAMALERAKEDAEWLEWFAGEMEKHAPRPPSGNPFPGPKP